MRRALTLLATGALALAGCGGDGGDGGGGPAVTVAAEEALEVKATEYEFEPGRFEVEAGDEPVQVKLVNDGAVAHDIRIRRDGEDVGGTSILGPERDETAPVRFEESGTYEFICSVGDHEALGMKGSIEVK